MPKRKVKATPTAHEQKDQLAQEPTMTEELEPLLDIIEVAAILRVCRPKIYDLMRRKALPSVTIGDRRFFIRSSVLQWIKQQETTSF